MAPVSAALERVAVTDARVVLYGEPGVGKSFAGTVLHQLSNRRRQPLERVSVRSPDAVVRLSTPGFCAGLEGGTLLLEGVDEASPEVQLMLLGLLEEWAAEDGGEAPVRVIATSVGDLGESVAGDAFRADLFYLLEVVPIVLPPLRSRAEEIPELAAEFARRRGRRLTGLPPAFLEQAMLYPWPGNLRELASVVERALPGVGEGEEWRFPQLLNPRGSGGRLPAFHAAKREFERSYVSRLLLVTGGNVTQAAELAGKARKDFYALMARNRVDPARYRSGVCG